MFEGLLKKRKIEGFRAKLTEADQKWEPTMRLSGEGQTTVIKKPVTNVAQSKGAGATKEMMREEREDYEAEQEAERIQRQILDEEERKKRNQR